MVRACEPSARAKAGFRESVANSQPLPLQGLVFRWGIDFAGPLPASDRGNKWILICIDHRTKWVKIIALPSKASDGVARAFLKHVLSRFGASKEVLTDQGTEFLEEFQTVLTDQQITHRTAFRDHPQADGLAEWMVQTLKQGLRLCLLDGG